VGLGLTRGEPCAAGRSLGFRHCSLRRRTRHRCRLDLLRSRLGLLLGLTHVYVCVCVNVGFRRSSLRHRIRRRCRPDLLRSRLGLLLGLTHVCMCVCVCVCVCECVCVRVCVCVCVSGEIPRRSLGRRPRHRCRPDLKKKKYEATHGQGEADPSATSRVYLDLHLHVYAVAR